MKTGFTLIELLAVIVILAIIALIATPIVLGIIEDVKESSMLRSAEFYLDAVNYTIAKYKIDNGGNKVTECLILDGNLNCNNIDETLEVEVDGEVPSSGTIVFENGKIVSVILNYNLETIIFDEENNLIYEKVEEEISPTPINQICTYINNGVAEKTVGAKYICEVKPGTSYNFYVLEKEEQTIKLIMDQNINSDGTLAGMNEVTQSENELQYNLVAWINQNDYEKTGGKTWGSSLDENTYGPLTAMKFLYNATKSWTNIAPVNYTYKDKEHIGGKYGYESFVSKNGVLTITSLTGNKTTIGNKSEPLRSIMAVYNDYTYQDSPFLYDNLVYEINMSGPNAYWTLSSRESSASMVKYIGCLNLCPWDDSLSSDEFSGVRPVIILKL